MKSLQYRIGDCLIPMIVQKVLQLPTAHKKEKEK